MVVLIVSMAIQINLKKRSYKAVNVQLNAAITLGHSLAFFRLTTKNEYFVISNK